MGTEKSRLVRLLEWAHQVTVGRGDIGKPDLLNTLAIIDFVRTTGRAVDCRGKAIVLNEGLVALGYHSRRISFQPDVIDGDSHSIVTVFSRAQGKWVCLDPTFNTYFHDDEGMPLGFLEIREAYRSGRVPRFRSIALPIRGELKMAGHPFDRYYSCYAVYMAKNCFRAYCPQQSAFGYESSTAPSWIALLPVGYRPDETGRAGTTYTTSARVFFRSPGS